MSIKGVYTTIVFKNGIKTSISTLSANKEFFFKIKNPKDLYWGLFCCPIAFFTTKGDLVYYNKKLLAEISISDVEPPKIVYWSELGNFAFFIERESLSKVYFTVLNLKEKKKLSIEYSNAETKELENIIMQMQKDNFKEDLLKHITNYSFIVFENDLNSKKLFESIGVDIWRP